MILKEKERAALEDLQTQEKSCVEKYEKYANQARDPELKSLFQTLQKEEQKHYDSLGQVLAGTVPECNCNDSAGRDYKPKATYNDMTNPEDKQNDAFLATDCIGTEKLVSGEYNTDVFVFGESGVRKLLADIQIEEQNGKRNEVKDRDHRQSGCMEIRPERKEGFTGNSSLWVLFRLASK